MLGDDSSGVCVDRRSGSSEDPLEDELLTAFEDGVPRHDSRSICLSRLYTKRIVMIDFILYHMT